ncbi:MAG: bifunctional 5,10-methylenetetrahydrofolate dehydrogenase/5,10-methenyltetrahydrofolate cyclohydrolase [Deltaproteobacteria bacterium]|nr:bifunctional 5,10-methylenetetrahydrofolate dehydrogenase/5,10-methenyltetrahydrofolate cyclohydrolase [Deltaproteobacteria bacterium]
MPLLLSGKPVAEAVQARAKSAIDAFRKKTGRAPALATVLVGDDPASAIYVRKKGEMCARLGLGHRDFRLPASAKQAELEKLIRELNADAAIDGILVQKPLPKQLDGQAVFDLLDPAKDVDCFSPHNAGLLAQGRARLLPCTPAGVMEILRHYKIAVEGKTALVIGRSDIVGKPMAVLLTLANATVTVAHSKTRDLAEHVALADIVVAAMGKNRFLKGSLAWKKGCVVIDVGMHRGSVGSLAASSGGKLSGDVDFDTVAPKVAAITPVPGGVGPMTIAMLMANTVRAAFVRQGFLLENSSL